MSTQLLNRSIRPPQRVLRRESNRVIGINRKVFSLVTFSLLLFAVSSLFLNLISASFPVYGFDQNTSSPSTSELAAERFSETFASRFGSNGNDFSLHTEKMLMVRVVSAEGEVTKLVYGTRVKDVLSILDINSEEYIITPSVDTPISDNFRIRLTKVEKVYETLNQDIPFGVEEREDSTIYIGTSQVIQEGKRGVKELTILKTFHDGQLVSERVESEKVIEAAINKIVNVGTKEIVIIRNVIGGENNCVDWDRYIDSITTNEAERAWLKFVIRCESGCRAGADNNRYYKGILQFSPRTFASYGGTNIYDGYQQINIALSIYRSGGAEHHWPACTN